VSVLDTNDVNKRDRKRTGIYVVVFECFGQMLCSFNTDLIVGEI
jgi:hypothetical protein